MCFFEKNKNMPPRKKKGILLKIFLEINDGVLLGMLFFMSPLGQSPPEPLDGLSVKKRDDAQ